MDTDAIKLSINSIMKKKERCPKNHEPNFYRNNGHKTCRECDRERSRRRWLTPQRRQYQKDYYIPRYAQARELINRSKTRPCFDCGIQYAPWVMQFDHRDPLNKNFTIGVSGFRRSPFSIKEEMEKCDVVCANCHAERTHKNRDLMQRLRREGRARVASSYPVINS
jgi:hypothetical protein